jgi:nitrile hydratase
MNSLHDVGGIDGFGPVVWEKNEPVFHEPWEAHMRAVDALMTKKLQAYCVDETRHRIERINPVYYLVSANLFDSLFRGCLGPSLIVF